MPTCPRPLAASERPFTTATTHGPVQGTISHALGIAAPLGRASQKLQVGACVGPHKSWSFGFLERQYPFHETTSPSPAVRQPLSCLDTPRPLKYTESHGAGFAGLTPFHAGGFAFQDAASR